MSTALVDAEAVARELDRLVALLNAGEADRVDVLAALQGLRSTIEELRIVEDELVRTSEELASAHAQVEFERRRYADLFAFAPDAHLVTDARGGVLEANVAAEELLQLPRRFHEGKPIGVFVLGSERRDFRRMFLRVVQEGGIATGNFRFVRRSGIPFDAQVTVTSIGDGDEPRLRFVVRDVTEERQNEARLWELNAELEQRAERRARLLAEAQNRLGDERAQFESVLRQLPVAVLLADPSGRLVVRNRHATQLFGEVASADELLDRLFTDYGVSLRQELLLHAADDGAPAAFESVVYRHEGDELLLDATAAPVAVDGRFSGIAYVFRDVTDQRRHQIAQRRFVVNAAHELRTPLAAIVSAVDVLQGGAKDDEEARDRFLEHLETQSARLTALVRALLLLARAQAGVEKPRQELAPIRPILEQLARSAKVGPSVDLLVECDSQLAALTNRELLVQALASLVSNAARFTREGSIVLRGAAADDEHVAIEVVDSGPGVSPDELEHVQDRFFRGAESGRDGFGLGLAIADEAARAAGGALELESERGRGTTARVVVPLALLVEPA
jgi:PAS domain S-box-containing protein